MSRGPEIFWPLKANEFLGKLMRFLLSVKNCAEYPTACAFSVPFRRGRGFFQNDQLFLRLAIKFDASWFWGTLSQIGPCVSNYFKLISLIQLFVLRERNRCWVNEPRQIPRVHLGIKMNFFVSSKLVHRAFLPFRFFFFFHKNFITNCIESRASTLNRKEGSLRVKSH